MLTIDQNVLSGTTGNLGLRKITKKDTPSPKKFKAAAVNNAGTEAVCEILDHPSISSLNSLLCLQEIDQYQEEINLLHESGKKILGNLKDLLLSLINGELDVSLIANLQATLNKNRHKFKFKELQNLMDEIELRSEVEKAKLEQINLNIERH